MIGRIKSWIRRRSKMSVKRERGADGETPNGRLIENVVFHLEDDALEPRKAPWGFVLRNPVEVKLQPKESRRIDLRVSADVPVLAWAPRAHADDVRVEGPLVQPPATSFTVVVTNPSEHQPMEIADGESLLCIHPLTYSGESKTA